MNLLNSLISASNFLIVPLGFSVYSIMSSAKSESFASSFPIWITFCFYSSLIPIARTSKTMLHNSGESGHSCLAPSIQVRPGRKVKQKTKVHKLPSRHLKRFSHSLKKWALYPQYIVSSLTPDKKLSLYYQSPNSVH